MIKNGNANLRSIRHVCPDGQDWAQILWKSWLQFLRLMALPGIEESSYLGGIPGEGSAVHRHKQASWWCEFVSADRDGDARAATSIFQPLFFGGNRFLGQENISPGVNSRENCMIQSDDADIADLTLQTIQVGVQEGCYDSVQVFNCIRLKLI